MWALLLAQNVLEPSLHRGFTISKQGEILGSGISLEDYYYTTADRKDQSAVTRQQKQMHHGRIVDDSLLENR